MTNNLFLKDNIKTKYLKKNLLKNLSEKIKKIFFEIENDIKVPRNTLNILNNKLKLNFKIEEIKKFKKFKTIALIGMGGSILGSEAIYGFLKKKIKKKIYFFDNLNENQIIDFRKKENLSKVLFIIISKSGNTIETLTNTFLLKVIKKQSRNIILISEKKNNYLFFLSKKFKLFHIEHKDYVGGRFSVLSEVGLLPCYLMGINIQKLRSRILHNLKGKEKVFLKNNSIKIAQLMNSKKYNNLIFLNYSPELKNFLFWCQQLIAESLGKKNKGFLPVISNMPKDHHSLLQLYLEGPKDKIFNIFSFENDSKDKIIMNKNINSNKFLDKKTLSEIKNAQSKALIKVFKKNNIPFREFKIKTINEVVLGKLFSYFILETIIVGKLININPFDQPAVEKVKVFTKNILK